MSGILRARRADGRDRLRSGVDGNGFRARAAHARTAPHTRRSAAPLSRSVEAARGIAPCRIDTADSRRAEQLILTLAMALRARDAPLGHRTRCESATVVTFDPLFRGAARPKGLMLAPAAQHRRDR